MMSRVHQYVKHSGELSFMDSTSNTEEHNLRFFMICTNSVAGGLPLAILITTDEKKETLKSALCLVKECLPDWAFLQRMERYWT